jgi:hypothetical protein
MQIFFLSFPVQFFLEWEMLQTKVVEKIKSHILCSITLSRKSFRLWDNVDKYGRTGQATDDSMAHAHCMLDNGTKAHSEYVIFIAFPLQP